MVALGRVDSAQGDVESAARAGVQAAVVQADAADAQTQATAAVTSTLAGAGLTCPAPQITTDTSNFVAGGTVSVSVTCVTSLADVSVPGMPGSKTLSATAVAHIDEFRTGRWWHMSGVIADRSQVHAMRRTATDAPTTVSSSP